MKAFAAILAGLHEAAHYASIEEFPVEAVRLLRRRIEFDGAVLGMGSVVGHANPNLAISDAYVFQRAPSLLNEYAAVSINDPVTSAFVRGLSAPLPCSCPSFYAGRDLTALADYSRRHDLHELLLFGAAPAGKATSRWIVLYRGVRSPFNGQDTDTLEAFWLHLNLALDVNRTRALDSIVINREARAVALVNHRGFIVAADALFHRLLQEEWPGHHPVMLPHPLWKAAISGEAYHGHKLDVKFSQSRGLLVCHVSKAANPLPKLSKAESRVASLISAGMTHKQVAHELAISPNTVRNHLKSAYSKLGLHNKAALAAYTITHRENTAACAAAERAIVL